MLVCDVLVPVTAKIKLNCIEECRMLFGMRSKCFVIVEFAVYCVLFGNGSSVGVKLV